MRYNILGRTGLLVSELCLGAMTFGGKGFWEVVGKQGQDTVNQVVGRSLDNGINFIDTADAYSEGESERLLGVALQGKRDDVVVATKVRLRMGKGVNNVGLSRGHIMQGVEASLKRLNTDYIDLYQIHGVDKLTPMDETLRALDDLVTQGKVRYIGCSNHSAWQMMKAQGISAQHGWARFESVQAYYTIASRDLEHEIIPMVEDQNMSVLVWSPLAGGLLSGKFSRETSDNPEGARRTTFDFPPVNREHAFNVVDVMREVAAEHGASVAQIALAWLLHQKAVTSVIIGAKTIEQLDDNLKAPDIRLSDDQMNRLNTVSEPSPIYPNWMMTRQGTDRNLS
jgi:aryl-alcohol dehydrogenase-like predicted oxidoreductase